MSCSTATAAPLQVRRNRVSTVLTATQESQLLCQRGRLRLTSRIQYTCKRGMVDQLTLQLPDGFFLTDITVNPANSGSPLLDLNGGLVGMNNTEFVLPVGVIRAYLDEMAKNL